MKRERTYLRRILPSVFGIFLAGVALLGSCRSPLAQAGRLARATVELRLAGSGGSKAASGSSRAASPRLLLPNASWLRLTVGNGSESTVYDHAFAEPAFALELEVGKEYSLLAEAGSVSGGQETALYRGSASLAVSGNESLALNLLPIEATAWPEIDADSFTLEPGAIGGRHSVTYRVRLGAAARWYVKGATGLGTGLEIYVQNEDGSAVAPSAYAADRLVVERSALSEGASSFLVTLYNASADEGSSISLEATATVRDINRGALVYCDEIAALVGSSSTAGMVFLSGKLYVSMYDSHSVVSLGIDDLIEQTPIVANQSYRNPWGIATDGSAVFVAFQNVGTGGFAVRLDTEGNEVWNAAV